MKQHSFSKSTEILVTMILKWTRRCYGNDVTACRALPSFQLHLLNCATPPARTEHSTPKLLFNQKLSAMPKKSLLPSLALPSAISAREMKKRQAPLHHVALPTAYCLLPTAYCLLPTAYCLLPTAYCLLPTAYCLLPTLFTTVPLGSSKGCFPFS
jgi:hypothetical protein